MLGPLEHESLLAAYVHVADAIAALDGNCCDPRLRRIESELRAIFEEQQTIVEACASAA